METYEGKNNFLSATLDMLSLLNLGTGKQAKKKLSKWEKEEKWERRNNVQDRKDVAT